MSSTLPLAAAGLTLGFNEPEDRLVLIAADAAGARLAMLMTRRFTHRLLNGLASLIERSSVVASQAPADLRDDIILMEHQDAVFGHHDAAEPSGPAPVDVPADDLPPARLATHIDVTVTPQVFLLVFCHAQHASHAQPDPPRGALHAGRFRPASRGRPPFCNARRLLMRPHVRAAQKHQTELSTAFLYKVEQALRDASAGPVDEELRGPPPRTQILRNGAPLGPVLVPLRTAKSARLKSRGGALALNRQAST